MSTQTIQKSANLHLVTSDEAHLLAPLVGKRLQYLMGDVTLVKLITDSLSVAASPEPGTGRSPADPYEELMRLKFSITDSSDIRSRHQRVNVDQMISSIGILTSLVFFTFPKEVGPTEMGTLGVQIPAGREYSIVNLRPFTDRANEVVKLLEAEKLVNQVDIGILIGLENGNKIAVVTNGFAYEAEVFLDLDELTALEETTLYVELKDRFDHDTQ